MLKDLFNRLRADDAGISAIEYGLVAMLIGVALMAMFMELGTEVNSHYEVVGTDYADAANKARPGS